MNTLKILHFSLVRNLSEYNTPVWTPFYHKYIDRIEVVQKKYIKTWNYRHNKTLLGVDYDINLRKYRIMGLEKRRSLFGHKTLNNYFDYSLINYYSFNVSSHRGRRSLIFLIPINIFLNFSDFSLYFLLYLIFSK